MKIYRCENCDKILLNLGQQNGSLNKNEIVPGSVDASTEKHVPAVEVKGETVTVKIGEVTQMLYDTLTGIQFGTGEDTFGWIHPVK